MRLQFLKLSRYNALRSFCTFSRQCGAAPASPCAVVSCVVDGMESTSRSFLPLAIRCLAVLLTIHLTLCAPCHAASLHDAVSTGNRLFKQEKYDDALRTYVDAQVEHPEDPLLKYNIAASHYKMKNYDESLKMYQEVAATARDVALEQKAVYNAGNALFRLGRLEEAVAWYTKALELDPKDADAQRNLEFVREEIKRRINDAKKNEEKQQAQNDKTCPNPRQQRGEDNQTNQDRQSLDNQTQEERAPADNQTLGRGETPQQQQAQGMDQQHEARQAPFGPDNGQNADDRQSDGESAAAGSQPTLSPEEAEQILGSVQEHRENLKDGRRQYRAGGPARPSKDW